MKQELRKQAIKLRKELDLQSISFDICQKIYGMPEFLTAKNVGIFYPKDTEINLLSLLENKDKNFYLPKVIGNELEFYLFDDEKNLQSGAFGILEPNNNEVANDLDIIFVPALMTDRKGYRLGWGGGFYDKYLKTFKGLTICAVPNSQITDKLPIEKYDVACNFVISEQQIIKIVD